MENKIEKLICLAREKMALCQDPTHDLKHIHRVIGYAHNIFQEFGLSQEHKHAVLLAAWWHDAGRTLAQKPSYIWMSFIDDMLSATILLTTAVRHGFYNRTVGLSARVILCKSIGTGAFFTKLFLRRKNRFLLNILSDADKLDQFSLERVKHFYCLVNSSKLYNWSYRLMNWWLFVLKKIKLKTLIAKELLKKILNEFISWVKSTEIYNWHVQTFGYGWAEKGLKRLEKRIFKIQCTA